MSTISLFSMLILLVLEVHSIPSYFPNIHYDLSSVVHRITGRSDGRVDRSVEMISWEPRAVIYHNFLSKDECEHVINIAKPHMKKSTVIDKIKGEIEDKWFRTGYITNLERGQDETIGAIEKRIADLTFLPVEYGEGFEVLRYEVGQKFVIHHDYPIGEHFTKDGGHTVATIVIYLSDVEEGGEEVFPLAKGNISALACWNGKYTTHDGKGGGGLSVKPKMGDALLFWNIKPDGTMDLSSLYGGCPVIKGSKWSATKGIHFKEFKSWD
ncbi:putative procollagen-proline 4-dioxygenase [Helianthus annuus]|uniref:procollagen-proline 4-dioxygenase n=2 Tax=Helianthus annuus TaxID=4232 RepID=A0A9K3H6K6_HELAN|nr:probable prolyl 4-hydroxylase 10 [Helianthus annuus]XP_035838555.1 probable prolyl 4-hydroxylase 10 [Helianthus annuus]KAF5769015.1 putative procollagen-proline 4-dioxygenase [Helianthus annuus]KAJ0485690.1 putative procollagen-proline 4-dioxygenase [Helianthus annuus]KAJ0656244.1 putative procollagen-proline 4-dioxygenase [Helianthus annuus]KAJ0840310.1 putative procollagen-proline 4-dioxygenase [Helianthus annuus]